MQQSHFVVQIFPRHKDNTPMPGGVTEPVAPVQFFDEKALELLEGFFLFRALRPEGERRVVEPAIYKRILQCLGR
jgi:hypothetical protein